MSKHGPLQPAANRTQIKLDALPAQSVVIDKHGMAWQEGGPYLRGYWYRAYGDDEEASSYELAQRGPLHLMEAKKSPLHTSRT